jgi:hypothetical protein
MDRPVPTGGKLPTWYRALAVLVGVVSIVLALIVIADPVLGLAALVFLLALALLVMGVDRLMAGITGHPFGPALVPVPLLTPPAGGASASSPPVAGPETPK